MKERLFEISSGWENQPIKDINDQGSWTGKIIVNSDNVAIGIAKDEKLPNIPYILIGTFIENVGFSIAKFNTTSHDRDLVFFSGFQNDSLQPNTYYGTVEKSVKETQFDEFLKFHRFHRVDYKNIGNAVSCATELPFNAELVNNIKETYSRYAPIIRDNIYHTGTIFKGLEQQDSTETSRRIIAIHDKTKNQPLSFFEYIASKYTTTMPKPKKPKHLERKTDCDVTHPPVEGKIKNLNPLRDEPEEDTYVL